MTSLFFLLGLICFVSTVSGQDFKAVQRSSAVGLTTFKKGKDYIKVTYGKPKMKSEEHRPFGNTVPFRKLWRTGDDEATEITFSKTVLVAGDTIKAGTYSLFSIPDTAKWTMMLNSEVGQWGHYKYDQRKDVFRKEVPVYKSPRIFLDFSIFMQESKQGVDIVLIWDRTSVRLPVVFLREER